MEDNWKVVCFAGKGEVSMLVITLVETTDGGLKFLGKKNVSTVTSEHCLM